MRALQHNICFVIHGKLALGITVFDVITVGHGYTSVLSKESRVIVVIDRRLLIKCSEMLNVILRWKNSSNGGSVFVIEFICPELSVYVAADVDRVSLATFLQSTASIVEIPSAVKTVDAPHSSTSGPRGFIASARSEAIQSYTCPLSVQSTPPKT